MGTVPKNPPSGFLCCPCTGSIAKREERKERAADGEKEGKKEGEEEE